MKTLPIAALLLAASCLTSVAWAACPPINAANIQPDAGGCAPASSGSLSTEAQTARAAEQASAAAAAAAAAAITAERTRAQGIEQANAAAAAAASAAAAAASTAAAASGAPATLTQPGILSLATAQAQAAIAPIVATAAPLPYLAALTRTAADRISRDGISVLDYVGIGPDGITPMPAFGDGVHDDSYAIAAAADAANALYNAAGGFGGVNVIFPGNGHSYLIDQHVIPQLIGSNSFVGVGGMAATPIIVTARHRGIDGAALACGANGKYVFSVLNGGCSFRHLNGYMSANSLLIQSMFAHQDTTDSFNDEDLFVGGATGPGWVVGHAVTSPTGLAYSRQGWVNALQNEQSGSQINLGTLTVVGPSVGNPGPVTAATTLVVSGAGIAPFDTVTLAAATTAPVTAAIGAPINKGDHTFTVSNPALLSGIANGAAITSPAGLLYGYIGSVSGGTVTFKYSGGSSAAETDGGSSVVLGATNTLPVGFIQRSADPAGTTVGKPTLTLAGTAIAARATAGMSVTTLNGTVIGTVASVSGGTITLSAPGSKIPLAAGADLVFGTPPRPDISSGWPRTVLTGDCLTGQGGYTGQGPGVVYLSSFTSGACGAGDVLNVGTPFPAQYEWIGVNPNGSLTPGILPMTGVSTPPVNNGDGTWTITLDQPVTLAQGATFPVVQWAPSFELADSGAGDSSNEMTLHGVKIVGNNTAAMVGPHNTAKVMGHVDFDQLMTHGGGTGTPTTFGTATPETASTLDQGCNPAAAYGTTAAGACSVVQFPLAPSGRIPARGDLISGGGLPTNETVDAYLGTNGAGIASILLAWPATADIAAGTVFTITQPSGNPTPPYSAATTTGAINGRGARVYGPVLMVGNPLETSVKGAAVTISQQSANASSPGYPVDYAAGTASGATGLAIYNFGESSGLGLGVEFGPASSGYLKSNGITADDWDVRVDAGSFNVTLDLASTDAANIAPATKTRINKPMLIDATGQIGGAGIAVTAAGTTVNLGSSGTVASGPVTIVSGGLNNFVGTLYVSQSGNVFAVAQVDNGATGGPGVVTQMVLQTAGPPSNILPNVALNTVRDTSAGALLPAIVPARISIGSVPVTLTLAGIVTAGSSGGSGAASPVSTLADLSTVVGPLIPQPVNCAFALGSGGNCVTAAGTGPNTAALLPTGGGTYYVTNASSGSAVRLPGNAVGGVPSVYIVVNVTAQYGSPAVVNLFDTVPASTATTGTFTLDGAAPVNGDGSGGISLNPGQQITLTGTPAVGINTFRSP